jgi:hypothetical protein
MHTRVLLLLVYLCTREHASERFAAAALAMDCCMMIIHLQLHDHNPIDDLITLCRLLCGNLCNRKTYNYNDAFCPPHSLSLCFMLMPGRICMPCFFIYISIMRALSQETKHSALYIIAAVFLCIMQIRSRMQHHGAYMVWLEYYMQRYHLPWHCEIMHI